jgi:hypothetical protein
MRHFLSTNIAVVSSPFGLVSALDYVLAYSDIHHTEFHLVSINTSPRNINIIKHTADLFGIKVYIPFQDFHPNLRRFLLFFYCCTLLFRSHNHSLIVTHWCGPFNKLLLTYSNALKKIVVDEGTVSLKYPLTLPRKSRIDPYGIVQRFNDFIQKFFLNPDFSTVILYSIFAKSLLDKSYPTVESYFDGLKSYTYSLPTKAIIAFVGSPMVTGLTATDFEYINVLDTISSIIRTEFPSSELHYFPHRRENLSEIYSKLFDHVSSSDLTVELNLLFHEKYKPFLVCGLTSSAIFTVSKLFAIPGRIYFPNSIHNYFSNPQSKEGSYDASNADKFTIQLGLQFENIQVIRF